MESRTTQVLSFLLVAIAMSVMAASSLPLANESYFYPMVASRLALALIAVLLLLLITTEKKKLLIEGSASLLFLAVALSESFLAYLQGNVMGLSYLLVSAALVFSSAISFVSFRASLLSMLPSQITILAAPLLSLPVSTWFDRIEATRNALLPCLTIAASFVIWLLNSVYIHRKTVAAKLKSMQKRQELLVAQMLLLKKQPRTLRLPELYETVREKVSDQHGGVQQQSVSDQVLLADIIDNLRESMSVVQSKFADRKKMQVSLDLPAPMSLPIAAAAEMTDLKKVLAAALFKSMSSLNGDAGVLRVALRVGYRAVSISIEDNGWGLREKFSPKAALESELSLREIQAMVSFWGGRLEIQSRLGVGSRMNIELVRVDSFATDPKMTSELPGKLTNELEANSTAHSSAGT